MTDQSGPPLHPGNGPRRILITGSSGLIGRAVAARRQEAGDVVVPLLRHADAAGLHWSPGAGTLEPRTVSGFDTVIHLAGEPVLGLWTAAKRRRILDSRVQGTAELAGALAAAPQPPRLVLCASGINFYGNRGDTLLDETATQGEGFLAKVCAAWEAASRPLASRSRVVHLRIGVVLAENGGALPGMLPIFRLGLGAIVAGGQGYISWITLGDLLRVMDHLIDGSDLNGAVNVVAPHPVTGAEFSHAIASAVGRRVHLRVPGLPIHLLLGRLADETILGSIRAVPGRLLEDGFPFESTTIEQALRPLSLRR